MPSIQDIPPSLVDPLRADDFVDWLTSIPAEPTARVAVMRLWEAETEHRLTTDQYQLIRTKGVL